MNFGQVLTYDRETLPPLEGQASLNHTFNLEFKNSGKVNESNYQPLVARMNMR